MGCRRCQRHQAGHRSGGEAQAARRGERRGSVGAGAQPEINRGLDLPWEGWTSSTEGLKDGELWLISGGTGIGKSLYSRSIALHLCKQKINVAYIGLEESVTTTYERMLSEALGWNLHTSDKSERLARKPEITAAAETFAPHLFLLDKFGSDDFSTFVATVKHYVLNEQCKVVVLDHFSLLADGIALNVDQRRAIDKGSKTSRHWRWSSASPSLSYVSPETVVSHLTRKEATTLADLEEATL